MNKKNYILNKQVSHSAFGTGIVTDMINEMMTVKFSNHGDKKFVYPDSFEHFLKTTDAKMQEMVLSDINRKKENAELEKARIKTEHDEAVKQKELEKKKSKKSTKKA